MKRYDLVCKVLDGEIIAAGMHEQPNGLWVYYSDSQRVCQETVDTVVSGEAFEAHKKDNERLYNFKYSTKEEPHELRKGNRER